MLVQQTGSDACTGDGGGPLLCPLSSDPAKLVQVQPLLYKGATPPERAHMVKTQQGPVGK